MTREDQSQRSVRTDSAGESRVRISDILAGGLAAAVAAVVGGFLGTVGSVIGAFLVSIVSGIVLPLLRKPLRTGEDRIRHLTNRDAQVGSRLASSGPSAPVGSNRLTPGRQTVSHRRALVAAVTAVAVFALAFGAIFVVQAFSGNPLSKGTGNLQYRVVGNRGTGGQAVAPSSAATSTAQSSNDVTSTPARTSGVSGNSATSTASQSGSTSGVSQNPVISTPTSTSNSASTSSQGANNASIPQSQGDASPR